jgi:Protein of unknown function (DUF3592)
MGGFVFIGRTVQYIAVLSARMFYAQRVSMAHHFHDLSPLRDRFRHLIERSGILTHPRLAGGIAAGLVVTGIIVWLIVRRRRPSAAELERRRREYLAAQGRITDGSIVDARTLDGEESTSSTPELLMYRYRIAGVTYDCGQDVSSIPEHTAGFRIDQPVQVKYDTRNPGNSIIVSETWTGLRMKPQRVLPFEVADRTRN